MPGSRDQADQTRRVQLPPEETGPVPVSLARAEPRWFGVPPPMLLLGLAVLSFAIAVALFAVGRWPFGLILLGLTAFLAAGFLEVARRRPDSTFTRASSQAASGARSWASARLELGEAVHRDDEPAAQAARGRLAELDAIEVDLRDRLAAHLSSAEERIRRSKLSVQETMVRVPEPYPPPDEGTPPTPAPVPEPYPPPEEDSRRPAA